MKAFLLNRVENIVKNGEIACFEQFLFFAKKFSKVIACYGGVRNCLYVGKGYSYIYRDLNVFKIVCCRFIVCAPGKGFTVFRYYKLCDLRSEKCH